MKPSDLLRRATHRHRIDFRTECRILGDVLKPEDVNSQLREVFKYAVEERLVDAYAPIFASLNRIDRLLKSLKYAVILALLLVGSVDRVEARHVRHHHSDRILCDPVVVDDTRVEPRVVPDPFTSGSFIVAYPYADISFLLSSDPKVHFPPPEPAKIVYPKFDVNDDFVLSVPRQFLGVLLINSGLVLILGLISVELVTGRCTLQTTLKHWWMRRKRSSVLVETNRFVPMTVSRIYCHVKYCLRLR